jgi:hypothetical protein
MTDAQQPANPYTPFQLENLLDTEWKDVRLSFSDWMWLRATYGAHEIDGYYLNGYGVEGLVKAALFQDGVDLESPDIHFNSEGDTCYIHFKNLDLAMRAAEVAARMMMSRQSIMTMIGIARAQGFEDS